MLYSGIKSDFFIYIWLTVLVASLHLSVDKLVLLYTKCSPWGGLADPPPPRVLEARLTQHMTGRQGEGVWGLTIWVLTSHTAAQCHVGASCASCQSVCDQACGPLALTVVSGNPLQDSKLVTCTVWTGIWAFSSGCYLIRLCSHCLFREVWRGVTRALRGVGGGARPLQCCVKSSSGPLPLELLNCASVLGSITWTLPLTTHTHTHIQACWHRGLVECQKPEYTATVYAYPARLHTRLTVD